MFIQETDCCNKILKPSLYEQNEKSNKVTYNLKTAMRV